MVIYYQIFMENEDTTIKVSKETRDRLNGYKIIPEEPLDKVINRIADVFDKAKK